MLSKRRVEWLCESLRNCQIETGGTIPPFENCGVYILSGVESEAGCYVSNLKILYAPTNPTVTLCFTKPMTLDFKMARVFEDSANDYVWGDDDSLPTSHHPNPITN